MIVQKAQLLAGQLEALLDELVTLRASIEDGQKCMIKL